MDVFYCLIFSIRVSNELGYGHPRAAKYSVFVAVSQSLLIGIFCMVVVLLARDYIAIIFTTNKEMQEAVSHLAYLLGVTMLLNSLQPVFSGIGFSLLHIYYLCHSIALMVCLVRLLTFIIPSLL